MTVPTDDADSLSFFFAHSPDLLFVAGTNGVTTLRSGLLDSLLGAAPGREMPFNELVHPDERREVDAAWASLRRPDAGPVQLVCRVRDAEGVYRTMACALRRAPESDKVFGSLRTLTEGEARFAVELRERSTLLRTLLDNLAVIVWAVDRDGVFTFHDGKGLASFGIESGQFLGMNLFDLYAGEPENAEAVRKALAGEARHWTSESAGRAVEAWLTPLRDDTGKVAAVAGITLDITDGRRREQELQERLALIEKQQRVIRDLSTPIIEVWERVLTLPMMGVVDSARTAEVMDNLLEVVVRTQARFAILDLTGVEMVDTKTASYLIELIRAIRLLGAEGLITGIRPTVAQTVVALGLDLTAVVTKSNLRAGLRFCIQRMSGEQLAASPSAPASLRRPPAG